MRGINAEPQLDTSSRVKFSLRHNEILLGKWEQQVMLFCLGSLCFKLPAEGLWLGMGRKEKKPDLLDISTLGLEVLRIQQG